ncbi:hypothetical protein HDU89_007388 [Geranomyces variabilis]|nr:hypothetical protein HDU89_007388 [Geranomyces variabilis]
MATTAAASSSTEPDTSSLAYFTRSLSLDFYEQDTSAYQQRVWAAGQAYHAQQACVHNQIIHTISTLKRAYESKGRAFRIGIVLPDLIPATGEHLLHVLLEKIVNGGDGLLAPDNVQVLCRRPVLVKQTWPEQFKDIAVGQVFKHRDLAMIVLIASSSSTLLARELVQETRDGGSEKPNDCVYFSTAPGITQKRIAALLHTDEASVIQPDWNCKGTSNGLCRPVKNPPYMIVEHFRI